MMKKIGLGLLAVIVIMQFFQIDKTNPEFDQNADVLTQFPASNEVTNILKTACYDCHSYETKYPWYAYVSPVNYWINGHIDEGREHLNFSDWSAYSPKKADHKLDEVIESMEEGWMPLESYTITHGEAKLTQEQRTAVANWAKEARTQINL